MGCGSSTATPVAPTNLSSNPRFMDIAGPVRAGQDHCHESILADQEVEFNSKFAETIIATNVKGDGW